MARAAIIIYFFTLLAAALVLCSCPGFFAVMAICAVVAIIFGSRFQRLLSVGLLLLAIAGFIFQLREQRLMSEGVRRSKELYEQRLKN